ncbi:MAG: PilZ domain-containing protein [Candidatus Omnitrophica bacterium]|nr:PilZ domain-containing protein [Candidatus Omnitrophota bacterium]MBU1128319.1 PilZ domain-containing protein [Candidatus Omnitrophota bacterium]MBU1657276.1 PilZ domain-containing protein [Candidatus Omnitrophota bacterium]MBU1783909.1 PilZ domain-containing protein [Candidatus Omnitrophota bacterium]MBU1851260.1 PilZ domain-containing protein [Candidatus Omnitrophota bacterium]
MYSGVEKRRHKRIRQQFMVKVREKTSEAEDSEWDMVTTRNLSAGGVLLNHNRGLKSGSLLEMQVNFPLSEDPINCVGKVLRFNDVPHSPLVQMAVMFTEIDDKIVRLIDQVAEEFHFRKPQRIKP